MYEAMPPLTNTQAPTPISLNAEVSGQDTLNSIM